MDPAWVAIGISIISMVGSWFVAGRAAKRGTEVALAVHEERIRALTERSKEDRDYVQGRTGAQDKRLNEHERQIGSLNREVFGFDRGGPGQPADYPR